MEGPTPVSALIHAATMVTAGVYLVIRSAPLFLCAVNVLNIVLFVGGLTAIFAATTALGQYDLKKIIAYSTCSQLGFMFVACGLANFSLSLYHLVNHAFFKALLFMGAGIVIHCVGGEQDMRKMGGFAKLFPIGLATMTTASMSLAGLPFLSGFYSKDTIVGSLQTLPFHGDTAIWCLCVAAAVCTSIYSFSLIFYVFFGVPRGSFNQYALLHGMNWMATLPICFLSFFSVVSGYMLKGLLGAVGVVYSYDSITFASTITTLT